MNFGEDLDTCPRCGKKGKTVKGITVESQLGDDAKVAFDHFEGFRFCATADCSVAYYRSEDEIVFEKTSTRYPIFQKEDSPQRLVCYCFNHSVQEIRDELARTGESVVPAQIRESCKNGLDDCARNNPQGTCCLGNVARVVKEAKGDPVVVANEDESCGCDGEQEALPTSAGASNCCEEGSGSENIVATAGAKQNADHVPKLAVSGALLAAMASSACCWLPLLLIGFGLSAVGVAGFFETYRLLLLTVSTALLGLGFYLEYFRKPRCEAGEACVVPVGKIRRFTQSMLWVATVFIASFALFPNALELWASNRADNYTSALATKSDSTEVAFAVEGMTCEACAIGLESEVAKIPGVESVDVNYDRGRASVRVAADEKAESSKILEAIEASGFVGKLLSEQKTNLTIEGMTCTACAISAQTALSEVPGVISAQVDYETKSASVVADSSVSIEAIQKAVEKFGYQAIIEGERKHGSNVVAH